MNDDLVASWLVCGAFMTVFLGVGLSVISIANVPSLQKLRILSGMILLRPFVDVNIAATSWVLMGWAMANGGDTNLFVGVHEFATVGTVNYTIWFFQLSLLFVSLSIVSGATLPLLINGHARLAISLFHAIAIFPPLFHWVWTSWGWASPYRSTYRDDLLLDCGVIDTAGASVIHMSAGCTGLVLHWLLSRRRHHTDSVSEAIHHMVEQMRFSQKKKSTYETIDDLDNVSPAVNYMETFSSMGGSLFLWMGFIGLNVATNLPAQDASYVGGRRLIMTVVAGTTPSPFDPPHSLTLPLTPHSYTSTPHLDLDLDHRSCSFCDRILGNVSVGRESSTSKHPRHEVLRVGDGGRQCCLFHV